MNGLREDSTTNDLKSANRIIRIRWKDIKPYYYVQNKNMRFSNLQALNNLI